ncbi:MAG: hypothetical protein K8R60_06285 [Burkholderiales bacterium]|nr:hypothetical protein [Burkholderiales bacterium]
MWKAWFGFVVLAWASGPGFAADLSATELRWLRGGWPVIAYAKAAGILLDVVVQPQPTPGEAPLALAFVDGRCKLVLSMRGNPEAEATLARIEPDLLGATLELMAAHELGHCRRYLDGAWYGVPAGFVHSLPAGLGAEVRQAYEEMTAARREEGYGDLVGLAWTAARHPREYARIHAWLAAERARDLVPGSPHDTLGWVRLATDGDALAGASIFVAPGRLWLVGLADDD